MRRLLPAIAVGLVVAFAFVAFFTSALHDPEPSGIEVALVGSPAPQVPGGLELTRYGDERSARRALAGQRIDGALIAGAARPRLLLAGASGANVGAVLRMAFPQASVEDVAPLPAHDSRGLSAFFLVAGTTLGSLIFSTALYFLGGHAGLAPLRHRLALAGAFALAVGLVGAVDTEFVADGLSGAFWEVAGIVALLAAVVALTTAAVVRWIGAPGAGLCVLALMLFSLPATGGPIGPEFVPGFYSAIAPVLPSHAALAALKGAVYFDGGGTAAPIAVLLAWVAGALVLHFAAHALGRDAPHPPLQVA